MEAILFFFFWIPEQRRNCAYTDTKPRPRTRDTWRNGHVPVCGIHTWPWIRLLQLFGGYVSDSRLLPLTKNSGFGHQGARKGSQWLNGHWGIAGCQVRRNPDWWCEKHRMYHASAQKVQTLIINLSEAEINWSFHPWSHRGCQPIHLGGIVHRPERSRNSLWNNVKTKEGGGQRIKPSDEIHKLVKAIEVQWSTYTLSNS